VSAHNFEFVKGLGANQVIDYKAVPFEKELRDIHIVLNAVGGDTSRPFRFRRLRTPAPK
jgi:NADPH:quinone reductase-like Zn-dependent oxidoreductase